MIDISEQANSVRKQANAEINLIKSDLKKMRGELVNFFIEGNIQNLLKLIEKTKYMTYDLGRKSYLSPSSLKVMIMNTVVDSKKQQKYFKLSKRLLGIYSEVARLQYLKLPLEGTHKNALQQTFDEIIST